METKTFVITFLKSTARPQNHCIRSVDQFQLAPPLPPLSPLKNSRSFTKAFTRCAEDENKFVLRRTRNERAALLKCLSKQEAIVPTGSNRKSLSVEFRM